MLAAAAGGKALRVAIGWARVQPNGPNSYSQTWVRRLTDVMGLADANGLKVDVLVSRTPCWASSTPFKLGGTCLNPPGLEFSFYPPTYPSTLGRFVEWLTDNYGDTLEAVEIWNEPNWGAQMLKGPNPAARYSDMVHQAHLYATNGVPIWAGSLHYRGNPNDPSTSGPAWTEQLLNWGIANRIDAWSLHIYAGGGAPQVMVDKVEDYRDQFVNHGAEDVPFAVTEFGWRTFGGDPGGAVTEQVQADQLVDALEAFGDIDYVSHALVFQLRDRSSHDEYQEGYGVLHETFCEKLAYDAVRALVGAPPFENPYCT